MAEARQLIEIYWSCQLCDERSPLPIRPCEDDDAKDWSDYGPNVTWYERHEKHGDPDLYDKISIKAA